MPTLSEKRDQLTSKAGGPSASDLIIPEIPRVELPPDVAKRFPSFVDWNNRNYTQWSEWRQRVNVALTRIAAKT